MIIELSFLLFMAIYWISEGCTEGYTWASSVKRKENKLIFGVIKKGKKDGVGILDYHAWRLGENVGMVGSILSAFLMGISGSGYYDLLFVWLGSWMIGYFLYERALNYICSGDPFGNKDPWKMMNISLPRSNVFDWGVFVIGLIIFCLGL
jgi:hypothetical protein|tara:strand:+ start:70 stop:519 length:450 start_codon:yes stop_codon:yes gene_type:complete